VCDWNALWQVRHVTEQPLIEYKKRPLLSNWGGNAYLDDVYQLISG